MPAILIPFLLIIAISIATLLTNTNEIKLKIIWATIQFIWWILICIIITNSILSQYYMWEVHDFIKNKHEIYISNSSKDCLLDDPAKINLLKNEYILALESIQKETYSGYNQDIFKGGWFEYLLYNIGLFGNMIYDKNILGFEEFDYNIDILEKYITETERICTSKKE